MLRKFFSRVRARHVQETDYQSLRAEATGSIEQEYQLVITAQLRRWGVPAASVAVEVLHLPRNDGGPVIIGLLRLTGWDARASLRILIGLPLLEHRVQKTVAALWVAEVSKFGGLWLHAAGPAQSTVALAEVRQTLVNLTGPRSQGGLRADKHEPSRPSRLSTRY